MAEKYNRKKLQTIARQAESMRVSALATSARAQDLRAHIRVAAREVATREIELHRMDGHSTDKDLLNRARERLKDLESELAETNELLAMMFENHQALNGLVESARTFLVDHGIVFQFDADGNEVPHPDCRSAAAMKNFNDQLNRIF